MFFNHFLYTNNIEIKTGKDNSHYELPSKLDRSLYSISWFVLWILSLDPVLHGPVLDQLR
jgi:hypothetical protein